MERTPQGSRHIGMNFERLFLWMAVVGMIGIALALAWMVLAGTV